MKTRSQTLCFCLFATSLFSLSYEVVLGHAGAHRSSQDSVVSDKAIKVRQEDKKQPADDKSHDVIALDEQYGRLKLTVLDENTKKETSFMVGITRESDNLDFRPPNAVELSILFEGKGKAGSRRQTNLPRTLSGYTWCVPGGFVASLPVGEWEIVIRRGIEHYPIRETIHITADKTVEKTIYTHRWENMAKRGWFGGDDHVHCRTVDDADTEMIMTWAKAEDLSVVNALLMDDIKQIYFAARGFGKKNRIIDGNFAIVPGQEGPRTYDMGHVIGLNITGHTWNQDTYHCYDYVLDDFRTQGGLAGYAHAHAAAFNLHRDMSMNIPKGKIDFLEIFEGGWLGTNHYYSWLNLGFRISASAGSDVPWYGTIGEVRVYVYTGYDKLVVDQWYEAMKKGRTFVTNGPMIEFKIDNAMPGDTIYVKKRQKMRVHAKAWGKPRDFRPFRLEIIQNGNVIRSVEQTTPEQTELVLDFDLYAENGSWVAARVADTPGTKRGKRAEAHTTPVYIERDGLRFWKYNKVEKLINARLADLNEIEELIQLAHRSKKEGKNFINTKYREWELDYRIERIISTADFLRERVRQTKKIYNELLNIYEQEKTLRSGK